MDADVKVANVLENFVSVEGVKVVEAMEAIDFVNGGGG